MSQTFHVLLCVICKTFQVQIVKKSSNKWNCKICDSKQSVQQVYAKGTGAECRVIVQRLNEARGKREHCESIKTLANIAQDQTEQEVSRYFSNGEYFDDEESHNKNLEEYTCESQLTTATIKNQGNQKLGIPCVPPEKSKWTAYLDDN